VYEIERDKKYSIHSRMEITTPQDIDTSVGYPGWRRTLDKPFQQEQQWV